MERVAEAVRAHREPGHGALRIGASTTPGFYLIPPLLGRFHSKHPRVELSYTIQNSLRIEEKILRNELDLGFGLRDPDASNQNPASDLTLKPRMTVIYLGANDGLHAISAESSDTL